MITCSRRLNDMAHFWSTLHDKVQQERQTARWWVTWSYDVISWTSVSSSPLLKLWTVATRRQCWMLTNCNKHTINHQCKALNAWRQWSRQHVDSGDARWASVFTKTGRDHTSCYIDIINCKTEVQIILSDAFSVLGIPSLHVGRQELSQNTF